MRLIFEQGGEKWIRWAKSRLAALTRTRERLALPKMSKLYVPEAGTLVHVISTNFGDTIRITAGSNVFVAADPFHNIWSIQSAVMPGTRPGVSPSLNWSPVVQHTYSHYENADGSYLRRHWLVICRFCERVAEYTWDEVGEAPVVTGGDPVRSVQGGVIHTTSSDFSVPVTSSPVRDGFNAAGTLWVFSNSDGTFSEHPPGDFGPGTTFSTNGSFYNIYGTPAVTHQVITGAYVSHAADGSSVTVRDTAIDDSTTDTVVPISPSLSAVSDANDWGWVAQGPSTTHPGTKPALRTVTTTVPSGIPHDPHNTTLISTVTSELWLDNDVGGSRLLATVVSSNFDTNNDGWTGFEDNVSGSTFGTDTGAAIMAGATIGFDHDRSASGPPHAISGSTLSLDSDETYAIIKSGDINVQFKTAPWGGPDGSFEDWDGTVVPTGLKAAVEAWRLRWSTCALEIIRQAAAMMDAKRYGAAVDLDELRPYDAAVDHSYIEQAVVVPAVSSASLTAAFDDGAGNTSTAALAYSGSVKLTTFPTTVFDGYVAVGLTSPADPAPPDPPWHVGVSRLYAHQYNPGTMSFSTPHTVPLATARFSRTTRPPLELGGQTAAGHAGMYRMGLRDTDAAALFGATLDAAPADIADMELRACLGDLTQDELAYAAYQAAFGHQGKAYRADEHDFVDGSYSFTQPPIT